MGKCNLVSIIINKNNDLYSGMVIADISVMKMQKPNGSYVMRSVSLEQSPRTLDQAAKKLGLALLVFVLLLTQACTQHHALKTPENPSHKFYGTPAEQGEVVKQAYAPSDLFASDLDCRQSEWRYANVHYRIDSVIKNLPQAMPTRAMQSALIESEMTLSPGDLLELQLENGEGFNGRYIVSNKGALNVPYLEPIPVLGLNIYQVKEKIELALIRADIFRATSLSMSLQVLEWAEIDVLVSGAVFAPGRQFINKKSNDGYVSEKLQAKGDYSNTRLLSEALRAASGIRPDAKIDQVILVRNGWQFQVDMTGIMTGQPVKDVPLIAGDQVIVPTTGCFQRHLARPSQITPKGFRVFMSNLIDSAESNSNAAVGRYSTNLPYGSRLLQAAVSANCVGGKQWTNAPRKVILASNNPLTGRYQVVERSVEELLRQAHDEQQNPYLMPNDAIACYDSDVTNIRDIAGFMMDIVKPLAIL